MSVITCIGSGNMGTALMKGAGSIPGVSIYFTDKDREKLEAALNIQGAKALLSNKDAAERGDFIFLAVKPQVLHGVLDEIKPAVLKRRADTPVIVSMAAGWSIKKIQDALGEPIPVVRIMPNTPSLIGSGMIVYSLSPEVPDKKIIELETILKCAGQIDRLEEHYLDAVTGLSGSGPAFVYLFIEALADGGVLSGLPRDKAVRYAIQTVIGAAQMVSETGKHPGELKDMVASPGGTTIAGLEALEERGFRGSIIKAVETACKRAAELG